jgi:hypothetical protein
MPGHAVFHDRCRTDYAHFYPCDFHVHSPGSSDLRIGDRYTRLLPEEQAMLATIPETAAGSPAEYEQLVLTAYPPQTYYERLLARRDEIAKGQVACATDKWAFIGITDHNVCTYAEHLSKIAWERRKQDQLVILPGIELDVEFPVDGVEVPIGAHILILLAPGSTSSDIRIAISQAGNPTWNFGQHLSTKSLPDLIRRLRGNEHFPAICIAAHIWSRKGVHNEVRKHILSELDAALTRTEAELSHAKEPDADGLKEALISHPHRKTWRKRRDFDAGAKAGWRLWVRWIARARKAG